MPNGENVNERSGDGKNRSQQRYRAFQALLGFQSESANHQDCGAQ